MTHWSWSYKDAKLPPPPPPTWDLTVQGPSRSQPSCSLQILLELLTVEEIEREYTGSHGKEIFRKWVFVVPDLSTIINNDFGTKICCDWILQLVTSGTQEIVETIVGKNHHLLLNRKLAALGCEK